MRVLHNRIAALVTEILADRMQPVNTVAIPERTLSRVTSGRDDYLLSTLVDVVGELGYDIVLNLRERK